MRRRTRLEHRQLKHQLLPQDAGRPWTEAVELLVAEYPEHRDLIMAYKDRWKEMLKGPIEEQVGAVAKKLKEQSLL